MWSNVLRFVRDGIAVGELSAAAGLPKARVLSAVGGLERWRYVNIGSTNAKREGFGSARAIRDEWTVRLTPAGRRAEAIWPSLFGEIERRWEERFGAEESGELRSSLGRFDLDLPEYLPIVAAADGMVAAVSPPAVRAGEHLSALLSQALLAYTLDFERESELSLPLSANVVRVLDEDGMLVRDLPAAGGISKEAIAMALTFLAKTGYVELDGTSAATKRARLTPKGRAAREQARAVHAGVEKQLGKDAARLRSSLERVLEQRDALARGLEPPAAGWRASKPYLARTEAVLEDPTRLPHYPMVLHRGGWPDGS